MDEKFQRVAVNIPYTSLQWNRKYYEVGTFEMCVPVDVYDKSWSYIATTERYETGMVQKVEYSDEGLYGMKDTVVISGFFLEEMLNAKTFLDESPEKILVERTRELTIPNRWEDKYTFDLYRGNDGNYYYFDLVGQLVGNVDPSTIEFVSGEPNPDKGEGEYWKPDYEGIYIKNQNGSTTYATPVHTEHEGCSNFYVTDENAGTVTYYEPNFTNGYNLDEFTGELLFSYGNQYWYTGEDGVIHMAYGSAVVDGPDDVPRVQDWKIKTGQVSEVYYEEQIVESAWQRLTDSESLLTEGEVISKAVGWVQALFGDFFNWATTTITGSTKTLSPSFKRCGDFLYEVFKEEGVSFRVKYNFVNNFMLFEVWRGKNRTQNQSSEDMSPVNPEWTTTGKVQIATLDAMPNTQIGKTIVYGASVPGESVLPDGYTQLSYIEATGGQYIDTGFYPSNNTKVELDVQPSSDSYTGDKHFLTVNDMSGGTYFVIKATSGKTFGFRWGTSAAKTAPSEGSYTSRHLMKIDKNVCEIDNAGEVVFPEATFVQPYSVCLFGYRASSAVSNTIKAKCYSLKIWENDVLQRDFVPCKNASGEVGIYDLVGDKFYGNDGTGSLVAGPEVVIPDVPLSDVGITIDGEKWDIDLGGNVLGGGQTMTIQRDGSADIDGIEAPTQTMPTIRNRNATVINDSNIPHYFDMEYQGYQEDTSWGNPWTVFSDDFGTIKDFKYTTDDSNYRNTCYVLYDYVEPEWDADGNPVQQKTWNFDESGMVNTGATISIKSQTKQGYLTVRLPGTENEEAREVYLDCRNDECPYESEWMDKIWENEIPEEDETALNGLKAKYDDYFAAFEQKGLAELANYTVENNLDVGEYDLGGYLSDFDLGDIVETGVEKLGVKETARIVACYEKHEAGKSTVELEFDETTLSTE